MGAPPRRGLHRPLRRRVPREGANRADPAWHTHVVLLESVTHRPHQVLVPYVAAMTGYRQEGVAPAVHRGLPSPYLTLVVTADEPLRLAAHADPLQPPDTYDALIGGLHTGPALISHRGRQWGVQVSLTPLGAGLTPKEAARVARFDSARRILARKVRAARPPDLAGLAVASGYYDQAHLTREWRSFSGLPPSMWIAAEFGFVQDAAAAAGAESAT